MFDFRITPAQVLAAYEKTRMRPARGVMYVELADIACGCGLGAMFVAEFNRDPLDKASPSLRYNDYLTGESQQPAQPAVPDVQATEPLDPKGPGAGLPMRPLRGPGRRRRLRAR